MNLTKGLQASTFNGLGKWQLDSKTDRSLRWFFLDLGNSTEISNAQFLSVKSTTILSNSAFENTYLLHDNHRNKTNYKIVN